MIFKKALTLIVTLLSVYSIYAQEAEVLNEINLERYLALGVGSMSVKLNDEHMSPLNYRGGSFYMQLGAFKRKKNTIRNLTFGGMGGRLSPKKDNRDIEPFGQYIRVDLSYSQQYYIKSFSKYDIRWYAGGKIKSHTNIRLNPQLDTGFITFVLANGAFASNTLEKDVNLFSRKIVFSWQVDLPLINHVIRPSFLNVFDYVNPEGDWIKERLKDSKWYAINKYSNITSTLSIFYPISTSNMFRLSYEWDFYRVGSELRATNASHLFSFSFLFKY